MPHMNLDQLFHFPLVLFRPNNIYNRKNLFEAISQAVIAWDRSIRYQDILEPLQLREKLGSTSLGHRFAIPHARIHALKTPLCIVVSLSHAIHFSMHHPEKADFIFCLLVPKNNSPEHLAILSSITHHLRDSACREQLRQANSKQALFFILKQL